MNTNLWDFVSPHSKVKAIRHGALVVLALDGASEGDCILIPSDEATEIGFALMAAAEETRSTQFSSMSSRHG